MILLVLQLCSCEGTLALVCNHVEMLHSLSLGINANVLFYWIWVSNDVRRSRTPSNLFWVVRRLIPRACKYIVDGCLVGSLLDEHTAHDQAKTQIRKDPTLGNANLEEGLDASKKLFHKSFCLGLFWAYEKFTHIRKYLIFTQTLEKSLHSSELT